MRKMNWIQKKPDKKTVIIVGAVLLLHVSLPLYDRPAALFFASMAAATVFEYIVGVVMEKLFKVKYWDYSEHRFQFRGYICLQSSLCWGFLGLILARFIHRPVEWVIAPLPRPGPTGIPADFAKRTKSHTMRK